MKKFEIIKVNSPSILGGESKNQDRVLYDPSSGTCCICDGVTSSPYSERAAAIVSRSSPLILHNNVEKNLETIADLLVAHRNLATKKGVTANASISDSMRDMVAEAAKENLRKSFQTTLICAGFEPQSTYVTVRTVSCGDSAFFAIAPDGSLLISNLTDIQDRPQNYQSSITNKISFAPGSEILTQVMGRLSEFPDLLDYNGIYNRSSCLVCRTICLHSYTKPKHIIKGTGKMVLKPNELLLVPKHLVSTPGDERFKKFRMLGYSRFVQPLSVPPNSRPELNFDSGNTTAVLPDHFYTGKWSCFEDRFPINTSFIICSDGFYRAFKNINGLFKWLKKNEEKLKTKIQKSQILSGLHHQLDQTSGDDDISFIWVKPKPKKWS